MTIAGTRAGFSAAILIAMTAGCLEAPPGAAEPPPPNSGEDGGAGVLTCEEVFGSAPEYLLCTSTETTCTFYSRLRDGAEFTCNEACEEFGAACLDGLADDDDADDKCTVDIDEDCDQLHEDQICVCELPPA